MVSFQDSINQVKESIRNHDFANQAHDQSQREHEQILNDYADMMRHHDKNEAEERHRRCDYDRKGDKSPRSMRFRFKSDGKNSEQRRHGSRRHHGTRHSAKSEDDNDSANVQQYAAHPFARPRKPEYLDPSISKSHQPEPSDNPGPDDAFRQSLFDAIADDEGAAYWEGVYSQPIHVYARPSVTNEQGHLEQMTDDQYVEYVKTKMWEKRNPEIVRERQERADKDASNKRKRHAGEEDEEEEEDYEWVGNEEKGYSRRYAGTRRSKRKTENPHGDRNFMADVDAALARGAKRKESKKWQQAWSTYQQRWQDLKTDSASLQEDELSKAIPWPVESASTKDVTRQNTEDFFLNAALGHDETRLGMLKTERVRWHPDKIQHRFGGDNVDAETLKLVTSVFQTIDEMLIQERKRSGKD